MWQIYNSKIQILMAKFFLRTTQTSGNASLYVKVSRPKFGVQWMVNTEIEVDVKEWTKAQSGAKNLSKYLATDEGKKVQKLMGTVEEIIKIFFDSIDSVDQESKNDLLNEIKAVVRLDGTKAKEELKQRELDAIKAKAEEEKNRLCQVWNYYEYFLSGIKDGSIRHGEQKRYTESSISAWTTFGKHLHGFLEYRHNLSMTFDDIDRTTATAFITYLEQKELMKGTISQQTNHFRKLCNIAAEDGKNRNGTSLKVWKSHEQKDDEKRAEIVLSDMEVDALYNLNLTGYVEQCRDLWILGYFSAQRVSDYSNFSRDNFGINEDGTPVIRLRQKKTETELEVPILDERVFEICDKYNYRFPNLKRDAINRGIKMACKMLAESVPTLNQWEVTLLAAKERDKELWYIDTKKRVEAGEKLHGEESKRFKRLQEYASEHDSGDMLYKRDYQGRVIRQRWELVSCHTTRRSMITTLHKSGLFSDREIMSVSGHSTIKSYEKYMKVKKTERATDIFNKFKKAKEIKLKKEA